MPSFGNSIPEGKMQEDALERSKILDCGNPDTNLASCNPGDKPPPVVQDWQKTLLEANSDATAFDKALAMELRNLVCANDANAIYGSFYAKVRNAT